MNDTALASCCNNCSGYSLKIEEFTSTGIVNLDGREGADLDQLFTPLSLQRVAAFTLFGKAVSSDPTAIAC